MQRINDASHCRVIALVAGAGCGKTTLLLEAANADPRPVAWVPLTTSDDDPAALLARVAAALDEIEPISSRVRAQLTAPGIDFNSVRLPRLEHLLARRTL
ncbi:MAG: LuxR family transcriptional regulator, partial [Acidimicrobiia bacterium]